MFLDYYEVLEIIFPSSQEEIKSAFRSQVKKWHPDVNKSVHASENVVLIYEAKLILSDTEAKKKYDVEYQKFINDKKSRENKEQKQKDTDYQNSQQKEYQPNDFSKYQNSFSSNDETLKKWMLNAKRQAQEFAKKSLEEALQITRVGIEAGAKKTGQMLIGQVIIGIVVVLIIAVGKSCN